MGVRKMSPVYLLFGLGVLILAIGLYLFQTRENNDYVTLLDRLTEIKGDVNATKQDVQSLRNVNKVLSDRLQEMELKKPGLTDEMKEILSASDRMEKIQLGFSQPLQVQIVKKPVVRVGFGKESLIKRAGIKK